MPNDSISMWEIILIWNLLFFGGLAVGIIFLIRRLVHKGKKCPFCAEIVKAEAIVCRYCGRDLPKQ